MERCTVLTTTNSRQKVHYSSSFRNWNTLKMCNFFLFILGGERLEKGRRKGDWEKAPHTIVIYSDKCFFYLIISICCCWNLRHFKSIELFNLFYCELRWNLTVICWVSELDVDSHFLFSSACTFTLALISVCCMPSCVLCVYLCVLYVIKKFRV